MKKFFILIILIGLLGFAWYVLSPLVINQTVDEALPINDQVTEESDVVISDQVEVVIEEETLDDTTMEEPMPVPDPPYQGTDPVVETRGKFSGADNFHQGEGQLLVVEDGGKTYLRFENFSVTNGPDLFVTLNTGIPTGSSDFGDHIILAPLKGNVGSQNYDVSAYDLSQYQSVSIYCKAFSTLFATATL